MKICQFFRHGCVLIATLMLAACEQQEMIEAPIPPLIATTTVLSTTMVLTEELPGRVEALRVAEIRPQVSGLIKHRLFEEGQEVHSGQPLFQIDPAPFIAEKNAATAAVQRAEAALAYTKQQTKRLESLLESDAASRQEYEDAVSQRNQAAADVAQAKATLARRQLDLQYATVGAPISGRVDQALANEGALVSSSDSHPMTKIQQIDKVYVDVRQPAALLEALQQALNQETSSDLTITILRSNGEAYENHGRILFSGINVDTGTGDVLLRLQVDNPKRQLLPGMFVRARVPLARYDNALSVPQQAVVRLAEKPHVWTVDDYGIAHLTQIELGELVNHRYRVASGLKKGQRVVIEGMERLSDGSPTTLREPTSSTPFTR